MNRVTEISSTEFFIPLKPQPAARPKISRHGAYYPKGYATFKKEALAWLKTQQLPPSAEGSFKVELEIICKKPNKPSNVYPRGDIDNYEKSYLDCITRAQIFWIDDIQVTELHSFKRYQEKGESYGCNIRITKIEMDS